MIEYMDTPANKDHIIGIKEKLDALCPLNRFGDSPHWSSDCVSADQVYRIHKLTQRLIEETGVIIQEQVTDLFNAETKVLPYNIQLIKIDRNIFNTDIVTEGQICQTITPITEDCKTYVLRNNSGDVQIGDLALGDYAIATYWTEHRDKRYKNWFIGKYMVRYV
jgi:hypothetical protein